MTREEIRKLAPVERVAGYLHACTKMAVILSRLRKDGRDDSTWTAEETKEWEAACDEIDPWWYSLSKEEMSAIEEADLIIASISRGEWPLNPRNGYRM